MDYYGDNDWRDYHLAHYGKKGMKWGKKKTIQDKMYEQESADRREWLHSMAKSRKAMQREINKDNPAARQRQKLSNAAYMRGETRRFKNLRKRSENSHKAAAYKTTVKNLASSGKKKLSSWLGKRKKKSNITVTHYVTMG